MLTNACQEQQILHACYHKNVSSTTVHVNGNWLYFTCISYNQPNEQSVLKVRYNSCSQHQAMPQIVPHATLPVIIILETNVYSLWTDGDTWRSTECNPPQSTDFIDRPTDGSLAFAAGCHRRHRRSDHRRLPLPVRGNSMEFFLILVYYLYIHDISIFWQF